MGFFFDDSGPQRKGGKKNIPLNSARKLECKVCPLNNVKVMSPKMQPQGSDKGEVYIKSAALKIDFAKPFAKVACISNLNQLSGNC